VVESPEASEQVTWVTAVDVCALTRDGDCSKLTITAARAPTTATVAACLMMRLILFLPCLD
jgi:hypothetical protein